MNAKIKLLGFGALAVMFAFEPAFAKHHSEDADGEEVASARKSKSGGQPAVSRMYVAIDKFDNKAGVDANQFNTVRTRIQQAVVGTRKFEVLEREQMKQALSEQTLIAAGMTDGEDPDAPKAGKMKAAGYVIYGNILFYGVDQSQASAGGAGSASMRTKVELQVKITNAENGKVLAVKSIIGIGTETRIATATSSSSGNIKEQCERAAVAEAAHYVVDALRDVAYPAKIVRISKSEEEVTINMTNEEVAEGDQFDVYEIGEEMIDEDTGVSLGSEGDRVGRIEVTRCTAKISYGEPVDYIRVSKKKGTKKVESDLEDMKVGYILRRVSKDTLDKEARAEKKQAKDKFEAKF